MALEGAGHVRAASVVPAGRRDAVVTVLLAPLAQPPGKAHAAHLRVAALRRQRAAVAVGGAVVSPVVRVALCKERVFD